MRRLLSRTSITIDEAVYILLGQGTGPIDCEPMGDEEEDEDGYVFCLREILEDELDVLEGEYKLAKYENRPADVIAEKHAALQRQEAAREEANKHRCAINHELNKGEQSILKIDRRLSNAVYTFITLHSFNEWRKCSADSVEDAAKEEIRRRQRDQEEAILAEIRRRDLEPLALPRNPPGRPGVKAGIREALKKSPLFTGTKVFDKAWERLRSDPRIADQADPPPPKKMMGETSGGG